MKRHKYRIHEGFKGDHKCSSCEKTYFTKKLLEEHFEIVHQGIRKFHCDSCGKNMATKKGLKVHIDTVHKGLKRFTCNFCNTAYGQSGDLGRHIKRCHALEKETI